MRTLAVPAAVLALNLTIVDARAESDHRVPVKAALVTNARMLDAIAARDGIGTAAQAKRLEALFQEMETFWGRRGFSDAVAYSKRSQTAAALVATAANVGDLAAALTAAKQIAITCTSCHGTTDRKR